MTGEDGRNMDKQKNGNTITIKINGKESPFHEESIEDRDDNVKEEANSNNPQSTLAKSTQQESAAAKEPLDDSDQFDWILPPTKNEPDVQEYKTVPYSSKKKDLKITSFFHKGANHKKFTGGKNINYSMVFAVFFAVLLGTFFGLLLLKIVPAEKVVEQDQPAIVESQTKEEKPVVAGDLDVTLPALTVAVVQENIYSTLESAEQNKTTTMEKGVPAEVFSVNDQYAIFVSMADNVPTAKIMGTNFSEGGLSTYSKEFSIGEKSVKGLQEEEKKMLELAPETFKALLATVTTATSQNISNDLKAKLNKQYIAIADIKKDKLQNNEIEKMYAELSAATTQFKLYEKNPETSTLKVIQQHLLSFLSSYQKL